MSNKYIYNYKSLKNDQFSIENSFIIKFIPQSLANAIRRSLLSLIPVTTFDDKWYDNSSLRNIIVNKNTSALHNEFLNHRLSLIPICMQMNDIFKIVTKFKNKKREYSFMNSKLPKFILKIKNNNQIQTKYENNIISITSEHISILNNENEWPDLNIRDFFQPDHLTKDFILINILKPNVLFPEEGEEIDLIAVPKIGIGKDHSRYCPVGTVSFYNIIDESKCDEIFEHKILNINKERLSKKLNQYTPTEIESLRKSFNKLDNQRVFKTDKYGNANEFQFNIESIGFLSADQLVYDSIVCIELLLKDIINIYTFEIENITNNFKLLLDNDKLKCSGCDNKFKILISNEDHTFGNLITEYLKYTYTADYAFDCNLFSLISYVKNHPLKNNIEIHFHFNDFIDLNTLQLIHKSLISKFIGKHYTNNIYKIDQIKKEIINLIFIKTISLILQDIYHLKNNWTKLTSIIKSSFNILDSKEYLSKYYNYGDSFSLKTVSESLQGRGLSRTFMELYETNSFLKVPKFSEIQGNPEWEYKDTESVSVSLPDEYLPPTDPHEIFLLKPEHNHARKIQKNYRGYITRKKIKPQNYKLVK